MLTQHSYRFPVSRSSRQEGSNKETASTDRGLYPVHCLQPAAEELSGVHWLPHARRAGVWCLTHRWIWSGKPPKRCKIVVSITPVFNSCMGREGAGGPMWEEVHVCGSDSKALPKLCMKLLCWHTLYHIFTRTHAPTYMFLALATITYSCCLVMVVTHPRALVISACRKCMCSTPSSWLH